MTKKPNMLHGLLQLVEASDGNVDSRIRMQKEAYLLAMAGFDLISPSSFSYHYYGPFSRELSDYLQLAVSANLLGERVELGANNGEKYSYSLGDRGRAYLAEAGSINDPFATLVRVCKQEHWRTLELAATSLFLEQNEGIKRGDAVKKAIALKPETRPYQENAANFLAAHFGA